MDSNHYFIGKLLYNGKEKYVNKSFRSLTQTQQYLLNTSGKDNKKTFPFINFGYIGKYSLSVEPVLKENLHGLLEGLGMSIPKMRGYYQQYSLINDDNNKYIAIDYTLGKDGVYGKILVETIQSFLGANFRADGSHIKLVKINPENEAIILKKDEKNNDLLSKTRRPNPNYFQFDSIELIRTPNFDGDYTKLVLNSIDKVALSGVSLFANKSDAANKLDANKIIQLATENKETSESKEESSEV